jgi:hypothetical protein
VTLKTAKSTIQAGGEATLTWQVEKDLQCRPVGGTPQWRLTDIEEPAGRTGIDLESEGQYEFGLECDDGNELTSSSVVVNVTQNVPAGGFDYNRALNDAWYNPETNGQGFFFNIFPSLEWVFLAWFTYDVERPPADVPYELGEPGHRWRTAEGRFEGDTAELAIYLHSGGVFNSGDPAPGPGVHDGTMTARFYDCNSGEVEYHITSIGRQGTVPIQRLAADSIPDCDQQDKQDEDNALAVSPDNKGVVENQCGETVDWFFDWPDDPNASGYDFRLLRDDALTPTILVSVNESEFVYEKEEAIPDAHLSGWTWSYRPRYFGFAGKSEWSPEYTFDVKPEGDPCL